MSEDVNPEDMVMIAASDNLYADRGDPDAEEMQLKALLTVDLTLGIRRSGLSEQRVAALLGIPWPELSLILRGRFRNISRSTIAEYFERVKALPGV